MRSRACRLTIVHELTTLAGGRFVVSLDFELHWGVRAQWSVAAYRANLLGVRDVVPSLLEVFREFDIHATWATVGMLFFGTRRELLNGLPALRPAFGDPHLSAYSDLDEIGDAEEDDPYHYAKSLVQRIAEHRDQEIATHTFSHYFCLEHGAEVASFSDDLEAAKNAARPYDITLRSLVFPGNQAAERFVRAAAAQNLTVYRGNQSAWLYRAGPQARQQTTIRRGLRLLDAYVMLSGHNAYSPDALVTGDVVNIPASRALRPYGRTLRALEGLRRWRIETDLDYAARNDLVYHLWWHPHNFGVNLDRNLDVLRGILRRFAELRERFGMRSVTMAELADELKGLG